MTNNPAHGAETATGNIASAAKAWAAIMADLDGLYAKVRSIDAERGEDVGALENAAKREMAASILARPPRTLADLAVQLAALSGSLESILGYAEDTDDDAIEYFLRVIGRMAAFAAKAAGIDRAEMRLDELMAYYAELPPDDESLQPPLSQQR